MKPGLNSDAFWLPGGGVGLPAAGRVVPLPPARHVPRYAADQQAFAKYVETAIERREPGPPPPPRSDDKVMPLAAAFFGAVFCCLGILALTAGLQRAWHGSASRSWPTVSGVVTRTGGDEPDDSTDTAYRARVVYKYDVKGATHFNNLRSFAQVEDRARYKTGDRVKVSYLPGDPGHGGDRARQFECGAMDAGHRSRAAALQLRSLLLGGAGDQQADMSRMAARTRTCGGGRWTSSRAVRR